MKSSIDDLKESKLEVVHEPQYGQFFLEDPESTHQTDDYSMEELEKIRLAARDGLIAVFVQSEFSEIPIVLEVKLVPCPLDQSSAWDRIVEAPLTIESGSAVLAGCPDGPIYGKFGEIQLPPGDYVVRVYFGGQETLQPDGSTKDFYRIELWPGKLETPKQVSPIHG